MDQSFVVFFLSACFMITNFAGAAFTLRALYKRRAENRHHSHGAWFFGKKIAASRFYGTPVSSSISLSSVGNERHHKTKQIMHDLGVLCKESGIEFCITSYGDNHHGIRFFDVRTGKDLLLTIAGQDEISPGVQRRLLKHLSSIVSNKDAESLVLTLAESVLSAFQTVFGSETKMT